MQYVYEMYVCVFALVCLVLFCCFSVGRDLCIVLIGVLQQKWGGAMIWRIGVGVWVCVCVCVPLLGTLVLVQVYVGERW